MWQVATIFAQKDSVNIAEDLIYSENFNLAIDMYKKVILYEPENPVYQFKLGFCYLHTRDKRDSSMVCFQKSLNLHKKKHKRELNKSEVKFYLARSYRVNYMFDSAIVILEELQNKEKNRKFLQLIDSELELAKNGAELVDNPEDIVIIQNLGSIINSEYSEHTPLFTADESTLIFTSRRKLDEQSVKLWDEEYDENIYISHKINDQWSKPKPISKNINTLEHEATIGISYDGTMLFIYKEEDGGAIYFSEYKNNEWTVPEMFGNNINTKYRETHATISVDGKTLFFTSDRPGGFGELDIYTSYKNEDDTWSEPQNMGEAINTRRDEEGPYIHHDNRTLYFSSKGHGGLGGYDILTSELQEDGLWTDAKNIGFPINSVDDDVFYYPTADGKRAYFSSLKNNGFGESDIYLMSIPEAETTNICIFTAFLNICEGELPKSHIVIRNVNTNKYYTATEKDEKFIFVTEKGISYRITIEVDNDTIFDDTFIVAEDAPNIQLYKNIRLDPDVPCNNDTLITQIDSIENIEINELAYVEIENILFPYARAEKIESNSVLDTLSNYLIQNKEAVIELGGYCDSKGRASYNFILGYKRAVVVQNYLLERGVPENQLIIASYGEENPITKNKTKENKWFTKSQAYNRRVEFKIIKQGETSLVIWGADVPEKYKCEKYKANYKKNERNDVEVNY